VNIGGRWEKEEMGEFREGGGSLNSFQEEQNHLFYQFWDSFQKDRHILSDLINLAN
jgi:hypothetical protein